MKRGKIQRFLFVSTVSVLTFPWLTPCVGIMSSAAVDSVHNSVTGRDRPQESFSNAQLKVWAAKPGPKLKIFGNATLPPHRLITDDELSAANGGMNAPVRGSMVGKGASMIVDGVATTLTWIDPVTWAFGADDAMETTQPQRQLILSESPFILLEGKGLRFKRNGKNGPIICAKATQGTLTIITPEGKISGSSRYIHYNSASSEIVLDGYWPEVKSGGEQFTPTLLGQKQKSPMTLNWTKRRLSCTAAIDRE